MRYGTSTGIHMLRLECMKNMTPKCGTALRQENVTRTLKDIPTRLQREFSAPQNGRDWIEKGG